MKNLRFRSLASGSSGNATLVEGRSENGQGVFRALVDCGFNQRQLRTRLQADGLELDDIHAIFVTHEHSDHVGPCFELARQRQIPVWASYGTWVGAGRPECGGMWCIARDGEAIRWGGMEVMPFTVPHDAREPLQLRISQEDQSIALLTDLGHVTAHVLAHAAQCDALLLEFNHDPQMLADSRYPPFLKRRIAGRHGHLSNQAASQLLEQVLHAQLAHVVAGHVSQQNNCAERVVEWMQRVIDGTATTFSVATQQEGSAWICPASMRTQEAANRDVTVPADEGVAGMVALAG